MSVLNDLAAVLGSAGAVVIIAVLLASVLYFFYMILNFGDEAVKMFLPFLIESFRALRRESTKMHPAIRLEMRFQGFFGMIVVLCLLANLLHALSPWVREGTEQIFLGSLITSGILFVGFAIVSVNLSLRLK